MKVVGVRYTGEQEFENNKGEKLTYNNTFFCVEYEDENYVGKRVNEFKVPTQVLVKSGCYKENLEEYLGLDMFFSTDRFGKVSEVFVRSMF